MGDAFAAVGVCIDAYDPVYPPGGRSTFPWWSRTTWNGTFREKSCHAPGRRKAGPDQLGNLAGFGHGPGPRFRPWIQTPAAGRYTMVATLIAPDRKPVKSYRDTTIEEPSRPHFDQSRRIPPTMPE